MRAIYADLLMHRTTEKMFSLIFFFIPVHRMGKTLDLQKVYFVILPLFQKKKKKKKDHK